MRLLLSTRTSIEDKGYKHQLTEAQHVELLDLLNQLNGVGYHIAVSCYENEIYHSQLEGWKFIDFSSQSHGGPRTERLYMNYPSPTVLHDFRFLGDNFRQRERIKKKIDRHVARLHQLPIIERNAILTAINESGLLELRVFSE